MTACLAVPPRARSSRLTCHSHCIPLIVLYFILLTLRFFPLSLECVSVRHKVKLEERQDLGFIHN